MKSYCVLLENGTTLWKVHCYDRNDTSTWIPNCEVRHPEKNTLQSAIELAEELNKF